MAIMKSNLSPEEGLMVYLDLQTAQQSVVLSNELHLLYLLTPVLSSQGIAVNWRLYHGIFRKLTPVERRICECIGVTEDYLIMYSQGDSR
jgi:DNA polymerase theta